MIVWCQKYRPDCSMMDGSMMFRNATRQISGACMPVVAELALSFSAVDPVEFHICGC